MKKIIILACAMIIAACSTVAKAQAKKQFNVSAMANIETMSYLRNFSIDGVGIQPNIEGSFQYNGLRTSLGVVLPCSKLDPVKIEWGGYVATDCTRNWLVYGGITVGARNHASDSQKRNSLITRGIFEGHTIYLPDYVGGIMEWVADVGVRVGYQQEFAKHWAVQVVVGAKYSPYCNNRWIKVPQWAMNDPDVIREEVKEIFEDAIDIPPVKDFGLYAKFGLSYCF